MAGSAQPFMIFLRDHDHGTTHDRLSDKLQELVAAVAAEGKSGTLTVVFGIKPLGKGEALEVSADIKLKLPKEAAAVSVFYPTPENNLARQDPRQQAMELHPISPSVSRSLA